MWHTVNSAVRRWGAALLDADTERISRVSALGLDEHLMMRRGRFRTKAWGTSIVDVGTGPALGHSARQNRQSADPVAAWAAPAAGARESAGRCWTSRAPTGAAFNAALPDAKQVAGPVPRRAVGQRRPRRRAPAGPEPDAGPPRPQRRPAVPGAQAARVGVRRTSPRTDTPGCGACSTPATPTARSETPGTAEETLRAIYDIADHQLGIETVNQLAADLQDPGQPEEINRLGRTITAWRTQISNWHAARVTNAPTEAANNLIKRVKRAAFGFTNFDNYRIRALLYAGKPNWALLETLTPT